MLMSGPKSTQAKAARLSQGYCGRRGCDSYYYRLMLSEDQDLDWNSVLAAVDKGETHQVEDESLAAESTLMSCLRGRWTARTLAVLAVLLGLLVAWQWHRGGTIPWLREAERFQVDSLGAEELH